MNKGSLYLVPTPLGDTPVDQVLPSYNLQLLQQIDVFIVEERRTARRFLRKAGYMKDFDTVTLHLLNEHTRPEEVFSYLDGAKSGKPIGLLSEAGCPAIADPGAMVVKLAHEIGIKVIPLTGPSSIFLALMASGFNGQLFTFHGYLPVKGPERKIKIKELERLAQKEAHAHIFIETPYRNKQMIESLLETCSANTMLCIASNITMPDESIHTKSIAEWRKKPLDPGKKPTVFILS
jgi:16S rRNA (cytidine1402-2'-O)-methyltransferase